MIRIARRHELTRRDALKLIASGIAALEVGCLSRAGDEDIVAYVDDPDAAPGARLRYASALALDGLGVGVVVETRDGRPIKIDGNPAHPASRGGSLPWMQARVLDLYDPQRATEARLAGAATTWDELAQRLATLPAGPVWIVMPPQSSPTIAALLERVAARHELRVVVDAVVDHRATPRGAARVYGRPLAQQLDLGRADVMVALDADVMTGMPMSAAWSRAAADRRTPDARMSRIWAIEPVPTATGAFADERIALPASAIVHAAVVMIDRLAARGLAVPVIAPAVVDRARARLGAAAARVAAAADDLIAHRGAGAVIAGDRQPAVVHALARWIDHACGNTAAGAPVGLTEPVLIDPPGNATIDELAAALAAALRDGGAGPAPTVIVVDANPVYTAPRRLGLGAALAVARFSLHVGAYHDETAAACTATMPLAHELETWSDPRAWDGTLAIGQPAIRPRFPVAGTIDVLAALAGDRRDARALVRDRFAGPDAAWTEALRTGVVAGSRAAPVTATPAWSDALAAEIERGVGAAPAAPYEIALAASPALHDGRFAANAWLQELPHPVTKQTWGNAALMSATTARRLGIADGAAVEIATPAGTIAVPALIVAGAADHSITVELGHGRHVPAIPIADRIGADAYALRADDSRVLAGTVAAAPGADVHPAVRTQTTFTEHDRDVAPAATLAAFLADPDLTAHLRGAQPTLLPARADAGVQWGMTIDTSRCTGCSACMVACQAENNIPTVGPDEVARGRHMNWIRIDRYVRADDVVVNQPVPCQHCEHAPCEYVCPVGATAHSPDGLNEQVYNRCIGTRFCSNNCPYKVRRFNWFAYEQPAPRALQYNPDVTVRSRGVMEKCTYCVQRIRTAEHRARVDHRELAPGEVATACQQACPTAAITFGQLAEADTAFAAARRDPRRYDLLHDLGTRPRTQYLATIRNRRGGP